MFYLCIYLYIGEEYTLPVPRNRSSTSVDQKTKYFEPSTIVDEFSYVTEQVIKIFQSHDPKLLVEQCETIMASDVYSIKFFSHDQIHQLNEYKTTPLLLQELSHLWSWSNHSVLRVFVGSCDEAIKLLDEFDCRLDPLESITSYPVSEIIPTHVTTQTILNVKLSTDIDNFTLQDVFEMCSLVINGCDITWYCPQLLATKHAQGLITVYWSIPKCIVSLISSKVLHYRNYFCTMGVLEIEIYPYVHITVAKMTKFNVSLIYILLQVCNTVYAEIFAALNFRCTVC